MILHLLVAAGLTAAGLAAAPLVAGDPPSPVPAAKPIPVAAKEKLICRKFPVTGSLVQQKRMCATQAEWDLDYNIRRTPTVTNSCGLEGGFC